LLRALGLGRAVQAEPALVDAFNLRPEDWAASPVTFVARDCPFSPDRIKAPTPAAVERWRRDCPLVRPVPYPYFAGLSIPSDCCGSYISDLYYFANLTSRKFGLDLPSSFWVFYCQPNAVAALYLADHRAPAHGLVALEGDQIDRFPLLLTYYYRGWLDHLHQWSGEAGTGHSLVTPCRVAVGPTGEASAALETGLQQTHLFLGLELELELEPAVRSFELELVDGEGVSHFVVHGRALGDRRGWDLSARPREELRRCYLHLDAEQSSVRASCLGKAGRPHLKSARVAVWGRPGTALAVQSIRPFDLTRACVERHLEAMRAWNLLPIACTNHGGNTSWSQLDNWNHPLNTTDPLTGHRFRLERAGLGAAPGSPSYCADLLTDFGIVFHNQTAMSLGADCDTIHPLRSLLRVWKREDGRAMYVGPRWSFNANADYPDVTPVHHEHLENLGGAVVRYLARYDEFGQHWLMYTHINGYNVDAFTPPADRPRSLTEVRRLHPYLEQALQTLSCLKYDLDGRRAYYQRLWCCPLSVALRFAQAQRGLADHARRDGNDVYITPWRDEVTGRPFPGPRFLSQDLHGQTFYVEDAARARVFCGNVEITSLRRNPPDFTGRPSVSIVDTETPTLVFDEAPLEEVGGEIDLVNAELSYPDEGTARGRRCLRVRSLAGGESAAVWRPTRFDNHETDFVRLFYRKSNPASEVTFSWTDQAGREHAVTEGALAGRQGWEVGPAAGAGYREVVLEYADMRAPAGRAKAVPRGEVREFRFGLAKCRPGDTVTFDRVEFLSARGVRPESGAGLVVGGRLSSRQDGVVVEARSTGGEVRRARTEHGGWYFFQGVARDTVLEISCEVGNRRCWPERGRRCQVVRNDLEQHIRTEP
jgi:hypothetical protein